MAEQFPKVSVVTVAHNRAHLIGDTVRSVLAQSEPPDEYIIIDDGSTDGLEEVVLAISDKRIIYHKLGRIGILSRLRDIGIRLARHDYIAFIDSDDLWHPDKLKILRHRARETKADLLLSDCQYFNASGKIGDPIGSTLERKNDVFWEMLNRNHSYAFGSSLFFRNDPENIRYDTKLWSGDHDFVLRLSAFHKVSYVDAVLNFIRLHDGNLSAVGSRRDVLYLLEYNRTCRKLFDAGRIGHRTFSRIRASNYIKAGFVYSERGRHRLALKYMAAALALHFRWNYIKISLKILAKGITRKSGSTVE